MDWSIFLFILKWIFLGLVYLVLILLLVGVTREMRMRLPAPPPPNSVSYGRLRVIQPGSDPKFHPGALLSLQPDTRIGTQRDNNLLVRDQFVSGHHARLRWDGATWWIEDLNSTNGTFVNQQRIVPGASQPVPGGAVVQVGDMTFEMVE